MTTCFLPGPQRPSVSLPGAGGSGSGSHSRILLVWILVHGDVVMVSS